MENNKTYTVEEVIALFYKYQQDRIYEELDRISGKIGILDSFLLDDWLEQNLLNSRVTNLES